MGSFGLFPRQIPLSWNESILKQELICHLSAVRSSNLITKTSSLPSLTPNPRWKQSGCCRADAAQQSSPAVRWNAKLGQMLSLRCSKKPMELICIGWPGTAWHKRAGASRKDLSVKRRYSRSLWPSDQGLVLLASPRLSSWRSLLRFLAGQNITARGA